MGFAFCSGLSLESLFSHQTLSCSAGVLLRHTRISQNDTSLVAIISLFSVNSATGTKVELLTWKVCVGAIGEPSSALNEALIGPVVAVSLSTVSPRFVQLLPRLVAAGVM